MIVTVLAATSVAAQQAEMDPTDSDAVEEAATPAAGDSEKTGGEATFTLERPGFIKEIHFRDTPMRNAFQMLALSVTGQKNIIATKEVTGKVTADLYGVTFMEALDAVVRSSGYVYEVDGNFIYVMTVDQWKKAADAKRQMTVGTFRLAYLTATDAKDLIAPALSKDGEIATTPSAKIGINTSKTDAGGVGYAQDDVLVVRDYAENIAAVESILRQVDVKPEQVLIEATILSASLSERNDLGIDFGLLTGVKFTDLSRTNSEGNGFAVPPTYPLNRAPLSDFRTDFGAMVPGTGLNVGFVSSNVSVFLRALEEITDTTILANPKLLVVNKMRGEVMVGNRDGYLTTTVTQTAAIQSVQFLETGTRLIVRPFIGRDGFIRMEIHPEDSSGGVNMVGGSVLPWEKTTEVTSNVFVRDGHTIVIGGLFRERTVASRNQVPLLGNIPFLGAAFRGTTDTTVREEVIILITPRIVRQEVDEATSAQIADDVERMRVGARNGLQWFGRGKLSQTYLRWAKEAIAQGNTNKGLCHLDMALSLQPRMIEAIHLKERIKDRAFWSREDRPATARIIIQQMMMQELSLPVESIVPPSKPRDVENIDVRVQAQMNLMPREWMPIEEQTRSVLKSCKQMKHEARPADEEEDDADLDSPSDQAVRDGDDDGDGSDGDDENDDGVITTESVEMVEE